MLLAALFLRRRRVLAGRPLVVFVVTEFLELTMKLYLPQVPIPSNERSGDFTPLPVANLPYPSGRMLWGAILLGALYLLSRSRILRARLALALLRLAVSRIYSGAHWASDVVVGAWLGIATLPWIFGKEDGWRSR